MFNRNSASRYNRKYTTPLYNNWWNIISPIVGLSQYSDLGEN